MAEGWPELNGVKTVYDDRVIEQDHGLAVVYNDWRVMNLLVPGQNSSMKHKASTGTDFLRRKCP